MAENAIILAIFTPDQSVRPVKHLLLLAAFLLLSDFPPQAEKAEKYIADHRTEWYAEWRALDVSPEMAEAVIWPEVLRYSVIRDFLESTLNYSTYVRRGTDGFDFSIGRFQIRPSFAERLERAWMKSGLASRYNIWFDTQDSRYARRKRIRRLQEDEWQCRYLGVFLRLLYLTYGSLDKQQKKVQEGLETLSIEDQVRLVSTAYNCGCQWPEAGHGDLSRLWAHAYDRNFHLELGSGKFKLGSEEPAPHYCYSDLCIEWYNKLRI